MKKFLRTFLLCTVLVLCVMAVLPSVALAEEDYKQSEQYQFLKNFIETCPDRKGAVKGQIAANYLQLQFDAVLSPLGVTSQIVTVGENQILGYNVVATIAAATPTDKQIIIGAHYDSEGNGANDNASGVTALYFIMKDMVANRSNLACNVVFVAFGCEEDGLMGSSYYADHMTAVERANTLLMFNIDSIANGDNLYVAGENQKTDIVNLILSNSDNIIQKPYGVGTFVPIALDWGYGYYETIQNSDHTPFRMVGIPSVILFSGAFSQWDYVESKDKSKQTMNSLADTLENLDNLQGAKTVERINSVTSVVCKTVYSSEFLGVANNARSQLMNTSLLFNMWWPRLVVLGAVIILAVVAILYYRKLVKRSVMGTPEVKTQKVFYTPDVEEVFSFDDGDSSDDIFTSQNDK